jgi:DNA polymerase III sliding clamp (beta) subunit (PCNA family)
MLYGTQSTRPPCPQSALENAAKMVTEENVLFSVENEKVMFKCGSSEMICLQIDGPYLDYTMLESQKSQKPIASAILKTQDLKRACRQAAIFTDSEKQIVNINVQSLFVQVSAKSNQTGDGISTIVGKTLGMEQVSLSNKYLEQVLSAIETEQTKIDLLGKQAAVVFYCDEKTDFYHVVMPFYC